MVIVQGAQRQALCKHSVPRAEHSGEQGQRCNMGYIQAWCLIPGSNHAVVEVFKLSLYDTLLTIELGVPCYVTATVCHRVELLDLK